MKYLILILLASCASQQPKWRTYRYITEKKCPIGTVLYSDDTCKPTQQEQQAEVNHYMDFSEIDREIEADSRRKKLAKVRPVQFLGAFSAKVDCKQVLTDINFCTR